MIKKAILGGVAGILSCSAAYSQSESRHETSVYGGDGLSTFDYSTSIGGSKLRGGGILGIGYNYRFSENWSISTGLELNFYSSKIKGSGFNDAYDVNDGEYDLEFRTDVAGHIEKQKATYLSVPVMMQFQLPVFNEHQFYIAGGFKFGIPASAKYAVERSIISNIGYYPDLDIIYSDQHFMGFGTFSRTGFEEDLDLKFSSAVELEAGMKWKLPNLLSLYTGAYFDYGLNDIKKDVNKRLIEYDPAYEQNFTVNSIFSSQYSNDGKLTDKVVPMSVGIKVKLAFALK